MPAGGKRAGAGRKKKKPELGPEVNKAIATAILSTPPDEKIKWAGERAAWMEMLTCNEIRIRLDSLKYLTDKRDGKSVITVNHLHDKPIEMNLTVSLSETIQKARKRATEPLPLFPPPAEPSTLQ